MKPCSDAGITIPLDQQIGLFEQRWERELDLLHDAICDPGYSHHIHDLGLARLIAGFDVFGDEAFHWSEACRRENADEELADYVVYSCTGAS